MMNEPACTCIKMGVPCVDNPKRWHAVTVVTDPFCPKHPEGVAPETNERGRPG